MLENRSELLDYHEKPKKFYLYFEAWSSTPTFAAIVIFEHRLVSVIVI